VRVWVEKRHPPTLKIVNNIGEKMTIDQYHHILVI
jgi:hypothetical protein